MRRHRRHQRHFAEDGTIPLSALSVGEAGFVRELRLHNAALARKLLVLGVVPGARVKMIQRFPTYVIQIGFTQIALDQHLAMVVRVQPDTES